ncbi:peptide synthetase [Moelleriella libera RCEF 2490]|uniref:Peptide synthetase n=1 Tax=Moelleriella libera RCEF 2490 TaxID=1081109 RepID=A0A168B7E3_9HYPO|nr:peptide synthetase [Moelleriella libera RCEF 2490]
MHSLSNGENGETTTSVKSARKNSFGGSVSRKRRRVANDDDNTECALSDQDLDEIWAWNQELPPLIEQCMHDIIRAVSQRQPDEVAVASWDGSLTYRELDSLSTHLAVELMRQGVTIGARIPLCFEKSKWAVVSLLGVMKTGATFSLTDPSQPKARLRTIIEQTHAQVLVTSEAQKTLGSSIAQDCRITAVSEEYFRTISSPSAQALPQVPASAPMYIIFTSGSTGKPKGVVISHQNYISGAMPRAAAVGYNADSRCFDFPSYAFDVSIDCMLCTLAKGGTICVPSEADRINDLSGAIRDSKANMVHMTPSVARVLDEDIIPSLDVLGLGGEAVSASDAAAWSQQTKLVIAYGPSECTVGCTINNTLNISTGIGHGVGGATWITHPEDHNVLVPVGKVGELLIEGPVVGIGYLDEPEKTDEVFIRNPIWLTSGHGKISGRHGRLYKTGDLVRYESNNLGGIEFVGRKDQQVKIRGQRVELTEVEYHLRNCLPPGMRVAAEVIKPGGNGAPTLVAFLAEPRLNDQESEADQCITKPSEQLAAALSTVDKKMGAMVPRYMVPAVFVTLTTMPSLVSGKTDRKKLREVAGAMPRHLLSSVPVDGPEANEEPQTEAEQQLAEAWRKVIGAEIEIYKGSNFLGIGGDSLRAMRLVALARDSYGLSLTVADIFKRPTLESMAIKAKEASQSDATQRQIEPFSLLKDWTSSLAQKEVATLCHVTMDSIEDVYPCTPLQEALMALSAKVKEAYVAQRVVELPDLDAANRLIAAFDLAQNECHILRTRVVQVPGRGLVQVVVKGNAECFRGSSLGEYLTADRNNDMDLGKPLVRYALIDDQKTGKCSFVLTMHHALYDGWCMPLIVDRVNKAYKQKTVKRPAEFKHFIKYLCDLDRSSSEKYWREQLQGANRPQFPPQPFPGYQARADSLLEEYVSLEGRPPLNVTVATVIRAAWSIVASQYSNNEDVVFGETLTGRNAPITGAEEIEGPMITTVPFRVQVDAGMSIPEYLQAIQGQVLEQIPHEHYGLQHIRRLSPDAFEACELKTGLVLHPSTANDPAPVDSSPANHLVPAGDSEAAQEALKFNTYSLMLVCSIDPKGFLIMASFDSKTVDPAIMQRALGQMRRVAQQLYQASNGLVRDITCLDSHDMDKIRELSHSSKTSAILQGQSDVHSCFIVSPRDVNKLLPFGAVGEVLVRATASTRWPRIDSPSWYNGLGETATGHVKADFFKSGIMARFDAQGRLQAAESIYKQDEIRAAAPVKRVSATSRRQRKLRQLWARVLQVQEENIGLNDNFFVLGGDSIAAMKLVSEARAEGVKLRVVQMFEKRTLFDMASVMEEVSPEAIGQEEPVAAFSLLDADEESALHFVDSVVRPRLADPELKITNVLPTRPLQQVAVKGTTQLPRYSARYELMCFDDAVDKSHLKRVCQELVARNEILRTVFIEHDGRGYGVVLESLPVEFVECTQDANATGSIEEYAHNVCNTDVLSDMPLGSSFVKWFLVEQHSTGKSCLVFKLSHAQYDEICLPILLNQLSALYEGRPVPESVPFSAYVGHVVRRSNPKSISYWTDVLAGSAMTILKPAVPVRETHHFATQTTVDISSRSRDVTIATLPTAAWALCLARRLSLRDVTFGEVVSGRNIDFPNADAVTGPCWQYVPVRVQFAPLKTVADLLAYVQHQHVASSAHEGMGLEEIVALCTDWAGDDAKTPAPEWFDTVVHQDVAHVETLPFAEASCRMETVYPHQEPLREWKMQAFIDGDSMTLEIVTVQSWAEYAEGLLADLAGVAAYLVADPQAPLF